MPAYSFNTRYSANKGSVLAISLVILTAITLVSVTAMQRSGLQGRMTGSLQHNKIAFHTANSELEEIYDFYSSQASATEALASALNEFTIVDKEQKDDAGNTVTKEVQAFHSITSGHTSTYSNYNPHSGGSNGTNQAVRLDLASTIQHTGSRNSLVEGFTIGAFVEYGFVATATASEPAIAGRLLSSQAIGIKYIAPAG
jgi:Tfp pilus assembly protein PilX